MRASHLAGHLALLGTGLFAVSACSLIGGDDDKPKDHVTINSIMGAPDYSNLTPEDQKANDLKIQQAIADCMSQKGWEYQAVVQPDEAYQYSDEDQVEQIKRTGLGVAYYALYPNGDPNYQDPWADWKDPNQDYIDSLSESEKTAYNTDLYGDEAIMYSEGDAASKIADPSAGPSEPAGPVDTGCQGEAQKAVYGDDPTQQPGYWDAIQKYYDDLQAIIEADPRVKDLDKDWSACMKKEGFDYASQQDYWDKGYTEYQDRLTKILGDDYYKDPMEGWTQEQMDDFWATATQEQIDALYKQPEPTADQKKQLEAQLADEVKVALAEHKCSSDYSKKMTDIYGEIEEQFALDHEEELKQLAASLSKN